MKHLGIAVLTTVLAGCATWSPATKIEKFGEVRIEANLPSDWMRMKRGDEIVFTRDGTSLEYIKIRRSEPEEAMPHTEHELRPGMLSYEIADFATDEIRLTEGVTNFELIENSPSEINGRPCYRLLYSHRINSALKVKTVEFGCWARKDFYRIEYRAAAQHYFDRYFDDFKRFKDAVRFVK
jgi:ASC-1-like (ASCH) protein